MEMPVALRMRNGYIGWEAPQHIPVLEGASRQDGWEVG